MKTDLCSFSNWKIYPGHGIHFIRADSKVFTLRGSKELAYFHQKQKAAKFRWTQVYRKLHKKGVSELRSKRRKKAARKVQRAVVGIDMTQVNKIKRETPAVAKERRDANIKELRERRAKAKVASKSNRPGGPKGGQKVPRQVGTGNKGR